MSFEQPARGQDDYLEAFLQEMNKQAQKLRLKSSNFVNPHGLQQKANHASASDIVCLMTYALKYDVVQEIVQKKTHSCDIITSDFRKLRYTWENTNKLINKHFIGGKTGVTPSAGPCLVHHFKFGEYESTCCMIDSKSTDIRWKEMATLQLWQFDKFLYKNKIGAYNYLTVQNFKKIKQTQKAREQQLLTDQSQSPTISPDKVHELATFDDSVLFDSPDKK